MNNNVLVILTIALYFLPTFVSKPRKRASVFVVNLFTGWTVIGWVIALAIAVWPDPTPGAAK